ncbi:unnamed protein product [Caretta caretta]
MMLTGTVGNALAMLLVYRACQKTENTRKKSFLLCIGSLALTDLTGQLLTSPVVIAVYQANRNWQELDPSGNLCTFFGFCMTVFGLCPLFIASAMAVERTLAIRAPHWYASHMRTRVTKTVLLSIWLAVFVFALLPIAGLGQYTLQWPGTWCFIHARDNPVAGNTFFASAFAFLGLCSLIVTMACNLATIKALVARCRTKPSASQSSKQWGRITMETLVQLLGIMCVLFACWSPLLIMMLKMIFSHTSIEHCKPSDNTVQSIELQKESKTIQAKEYDFFSAVYIMFSGDFSFFEGEESIIFMSVPKRLSSCCGLRTADDIDMTLRLHFLVKDWNGMLGPDNGMGH